MHLSETSPVRGHLWREDVQVAVCGGSRRYPPIGNMHIWIRCFGAVVAHDVPVVRTRARIGHRHPQTAALSRAQSVHSHRESDDDPEEVI